MHSILIFRTREAAYDGLSETMKRLKIKRNKVMYLIMSPPPPLLVRSEFSLWTSITECRFLCLFLWCIFHIDGFHCWLQRKRKFNKELRVLVICVKVVTKSSLNKIKNQNPYDRFVFVSRELKIRQR